MADQRRTIADLLSRLADNTIGAISAQDLRDLMVSLIPVYGGFYFDTPAPTTPGGVGTPTKAAGATTQIAASAEGDFTTVDNRAIYTGAPTILALVLCHVSMTSAGNNQLSSLGIAKNGTQEVHSEIPRQIGTGMDVGSIGCLGLIQLATNDYVEVFVTNDTSVATLTVEKGVLAVLTLPL